MGFSISWLAVNGKESESVLRDLHLAPTGDRDELPAESPIAAAAVEGGWYVIVFDRCDHELLNDDVLRRVSEGCAVVVAAAEGHVGYSAASGWRNGGRLWWSKHDAQADLYDLDARGALPEGFDALRRRQLDEQDAAGGRTAGVDHVFAIPLEVARLVTCFAHDEAESAGGFAVLRVAPA